MKIQKGFFALGMERISKNRNAGAIVRTAHAFGAEFVFTVASCIHIKALYDSDTTKTLKHVPFFQYASYQQLQMPSNCHVVGVELCDNSLMLPHFRHPRRAVYVFGPERGKLSTHMQNHCDFMVKIPTKFCLNVSIAVAIVLYDRVSSLWTIPRPITAQQQKYTHAQLHKK